MQPGCGLLYCGEVPASGWESGGRWPDQPRQEAGPRGGVASCRSLGDGTAGLISEACAHFFLGTIGSTGRPISLPRSFRPVAERDVWRVAGSMVEGQREDKSCVLITLYLKLL